VLHTTGTKIDIVNGKGAINYITNY